MKSKTLSVHIFRRMARQKERRLQEWLRNPLGPQPPDAAELPPWARGVRVEKAGLFQFAVIATENRGY